MDAARRRLQDAPAAGNTGLCERIARELAALDGDDVVREQHRAEAASIASPAR